MELSKYMTVDAKKFIADYKLNSERLKIKRDQLAALDGASALPIAEKVQSTPKATLEDLVLKRIMLERQIADLEDYFRLFNLCSEAMDKDERTALEAMTATTWPISDICKRCHVQRSRAFEIKDSVEKKIQKLLG